MRRFVFAATVAVSILFAIVDQASASVWLEPTVVVESNWNSAYNWSGFSVPYSINHVADCSQLDITTNMVLSQASHNRTIGHLMLGDTAGNQTYTIDFVTSNPGGAKRLVFDASSSNATIRFGGTETNGSHSIVGAIQLDTNLSITGNATSLYVGANLDIASVLDSSNRVVMYTGQINWSDVVGFQGDARPALSFGGTDAVPNTVAQLVVTNGLVLSRGSRSDQFGALPGTYMADFLRLDGAAVGSGSNAVMTFEANRGITLGAKGGVLLAGSASRGIVVNSAISGSGKLCSMGVPGNQGTNTLNAANTYSRETLVRDSTLVIGSSGSILASRAVYVYSNSILRLQQTNALASSADVCLSSAGGAGCGKVDLDFSGEQTVNNLYVDGAAQPAGTYGSSAGSAGTTNDTWFAGGGTLKVLSGGTLASLTVQATAGGTVVPAGQTNVTSGVPTAITATASNGYAFVNWSVESGTAIITNSNAAATTVTLSSPALIQANFTELKAVVSSSTVYVAEGGTSVLQVKLSAQPTSAVTVAVAWTAGDSDISITAGASLIFTTNNWNAYQPVTLAAGEDLDSESGSATIVCSGASLMDVAVTATELDSGGVGYCVVSNVLYAVHSFTTVGGSEFVAPSGVSMVEVLVVGGGAGGGPGESLFGGGGGGGGGGVVHTNVAVISGTGYVVSVGAGGIRFGFDRHGKGASSSFADLVGLGGGQAISGTNGGDGASGAGGSGVGCSGGLALQPGSASGGFGYNGGMGGGSTNPLVLGSGGGGGGGGGVGGAGMATAGGSGGAGYATTISGALRSYAGGGGGGGLTNGVGGAAVAGGGNGADGSRWLGDSVPYGGDGTPGTGGGGGGGGLREDVNGLFGNYGGAGGSGIVIVRYPATDGDGDMMADRWETLYLGGTNAAPPDEDTDGDGVNNQLEFLAGTDPLDETSWFGFMSVTGSPAVVTWQSVEGKNYTLLTTTNLLDGFNTVVSSNLAATAPLNVYTDAVSGASQRFYRLRLE